MKFKNFNFISFDESLTEECLSKLVKLGIKNGKKIKSGVGIYCIEDNEVVSSFPVDTDDLKVLGVRSVLLLLSSEKGLNSLKDFR